VVELFPHDSAATSIAVRTLREGVLYGFFPVTGSFVFSTEALLLSIEPFFYFPDSAVAVLILQGVSCYDTYYIPYRDVLLIALSHVVVATEYRGRNQRKEYSVHCRMPLQNSRLPFHTVDNTNLRMTKCTNTSAEFGGKRTLKSGQILDRW
jgi:hypothetical protein